MYDLQRNTGGVTNVSRYMESYSDALHLSAKQIPGVAAVFEQELAG